MERKRAIFSRCGKCGCTEKCEGQKQARTARLVFPHKFEIISEESGVTVTIDRDFYLNHTDSLSPKTDDLTLREGSFRCSSTRFIFCQIRSSMNSGTEAEIYYESKVLELIYQVFLKKASASRLLPDEDLETVTRIQSFILNNLGGCLTICRLSREAHTCPAKLQSDFKAAFGCTVHSFVQSERMKKAAEMLASTNRPIYLIAKDVGCKKAGRFSENFKAAYGVSPSEFREQFDG